MGEEKLSRVPALKSRMRYFLTLFTLFVAMALAVGGGASLQNARAQEDSLLGLESTDAEIQNEAQADQLSTSESIEQPAQSPTEQPTPLSAEEPDSSISQPTIDEESPLTPQDSPTADLEVESAISEDQDLDSLEPEIADFDTENMAVPQDSRAAPRNFDLTCNHGDVYAVQADGKVVKYAGQGAAAQSMMIDGLSGWENVGGNTSYPYTALNGLAISNDPLKMYANTIKEKRVFPSPVAHQYVVIFVYDAVNGWKTHTFDGLFPFDDKKPSKNELILGGFNPNDGRYYFGGYQRIDGEWKIVIYAWKESESWPTKIGELSPGLGENSNGDLAFDIYGNLYVVLGPFNSSAYQIYTVTSDDLADNNGSISPSSSKTIEVIGFPSGFHGVGFDVDGTMYLAGLGSDNKSKIVTANPVTGELMNGGAVYARPDRSSDIATCRYPPTITIKKDIVERVNPTDQFQLTLYKGQTTDIYGQVTTTGENTGIQAEQVGPFPVYANRTYNFGEAVAGTSNLENYTTTYECVNLAKPDEILPSGTGTSGSVAAKFDPNKPANIVCTFTNKPPTPTANLKVLKKDSTDQSFLAGASFKLWKDVNENGEWDLDDTEIPGSEKPITVANEGVLWNELELGKYIIEETVAPTGYTISNQYTAVTLNKADADTTVTVEVLDARKLGLVSWSKVAGSDTGPALAGSEWKITKDPGTPTSQAWPVVDCVSDPCATGDGKDVDERPGFFKVEGLQWGNYQLVETKAPAGYVLDETPYPFTVSKDKLEITLDPVVNKQVVPPVIPITGGVGSDFYLISGGLLIAVSVGFSAADKRRRKKLQKVSS